MIKGSKASDKTKRRQSISRKAFFQTKKGLQEKERMRERNKGKKLSEETKNRISKSLRGESPLFGKHFSDETIERLRNAHVGKKLSEEHKQNISKSLIGREHTDETKRKISEGNSGKKRSDETRKNMSSLMKIKWKDYKTGNFFNESLKKCEKTCFKKGDEHPRFGKHLSEDYKRKISEAKRGTIFSEEHKRKISEAKKGSITSEATKEKLRKFMTGRYVGEKNPNFGKHPSQETINKLKDAHRLEKHWNWLGGLSFELYGKEFDEEFKESIRKRDFYTCQLCGKYQEGLKRKLSIHHKDYNKKNNDPVNCISLCGKCHIKTNYNRKMWTIKFKDAEQNRKVYIPVVSSSGLAIDLCLSDN